ncbi:MAG: hypothetical protein AAGM38_06955 [Pseudomonadota bacterium]
MRGDRGGAQAEKGRGAITLAIAAAAILAIAAVGPAWAQAADPQAADAPQAEPTPAEPTPSEAAPAADKPLAAHPISAEIAETGLAATEARLGALPAPRPDELFALAGVRFLSAVEGAAQLRYRYNAGAVDYAPMLRLPLPANPEPEPFDPGMVEALFTAVLEDMAGVESALAALPPEALEGDALGLTLSLDDLWIDANGNGARDEAGPVTETMMDLTGGVLGAPLRGMRGTLVRFDAADVAWLRAYAHLLSGVSEVVLSLDPTAALTAAQPGWEASATFRAEGGAFGAEMWADQAAATLLLFRGAPDAARTRAALAHFEAMIAQNRVFWERVFIEEDDRGEWIPNPTQASALGGATLTREMAEGWIAVLGELEQVLKGELLMPHWRYAADAEGNSVGVNLRRVFEDPASVDLVLWLQGAAAVPYLEVGPLADGRTLNAFDTLVRGRSLALAVWFN